MQDLELKDIIKAHKRISSYIHKTPVLTSSLLNQKLGHEIFFKAECLQKVGAFKARGAMNTLLWLSEKKMFPSKVVAFSSGNHAQAVSWASSKLGLTSEIFMPEWVSSIKLQATKEYGAKVTLCRHRQEAEDKAYNAKEQGAYLLPPFDHDQVICGQGTACLEAFSQVDQPISAVFAPCGGGGLLSGTVIAAKGKSPEISVIGSEPLLANDAAQSLRQGKIFRWDKSPDTLADGAKTLSVTQRTLNYLNRLDDFHEISEQEIIYWTQWLCHFLKLHIEPTSALAMASAIKWLRTQNSQKSILVILSGGNMDPKTLQRVWSQDHLGGPPFLNLSL